MNKQTFNSEHIISKLEYYNYKYQLKDKTLKVFLPMLCYLKIKFSTNGIKMTSHLRFGFDYLPLEYNFLIYGVILYLLAWFQWTTLNIGIFIFIGLLLIHFVICFIKIESLRTIIHKWMEQDL